MNHRQTLKSPRIIYVSHGIICHFKDILYLYDEYIKHCKIIYLISLFHSVVDMPD